MKRIFTAFIAMVLLLSSSIVFADTYEKPILFRGAEWGSTYAEVVSALSDSLILDYAGEITYNISFDDMLFDDSGRTLYRGVTGFYAKPASLEGLKVAGYDLSYLNAYFIHLPGKDGLQIRDREHSAFIYALYKFYPVDSDAAFTDLTEKLTSIYGDVDFSRNDASNTDHQRIWNGAEGTLISLVKDDIMQSISIKYSFAGAEELLDAAYEAVKLEEALKVESNLDGL